MAAVTLLENTPKTIFVFSVLDWNYNPGQNTSGHLSNFGRKVENLLYMLPSLYEQCLLLFRCFFCAPLSPTQCWNMPAIDERILILETVKNQHCNGGRGKARIVPTVLTRIVASLKWRLLRGNLFKCKYFLI